jgi:hypothetical protein
MCPDLHASTCEQAYILIRRGLNLRDREWRVFANEPDLDTVLAIWLLLNHARLSDEESGLRRKILPLVRLEGVIDVHGLELTELACLSDEEFARANGHLAELMAEEVALKREGTWGETDYGEYTLRLLRRIDEIVYSPWDFEGFKIVDEIARVSLTPTHIAVLCRSESGIYDVEKQLRAVHGARLGIIALDRGEGHYTLRQVNLFMNANLQRVYARLNAIDPAVRGSNRWGGSDQIGGSPRQSGSGLRPEQIADALVRAFRPVTTRDLASASLTALLAVAGTVLSGWAGGYFLDSLWSLLATLGTATAIFLVICAGKYPRVYGFKTPEGRDWLFLLPAAVAGGLLGGAWLYPEFKSRGKSGRPGYFWSDPRCRSWPSCSSGAWPTVCWPKNCGFSAARSLVSFLARSWLDAALPPGDRIGTLADRRLEIARSPGGPAIGRNARSVVSFDWSRHPGAACGMARERAEASSPRSCFISRRYLPPPTCSRRFDGERPGATAPATGWGAISAPPRG